MNVLVVGADRHGVEAQNLQPFRRFRKELAREAGARFDVVVCPTSAERQAVIAERRSDVVFVQPHWKEEPAAVVAEMRQLHQRPGRPRVVFLDAVDQTSSRLFGVLPWVDLFVKKQLLADRAGYERELAGGTVVSDYYARECGVALNGWHSGEPWTGGHWDKVMLGWNLAVADFLVDGLLRRDWLPWRRAVRRDIDVSCRVGLGQADTRDWRRWHRMLAVERLKELESDGLRVVAEGALDGRGARPRQYLSELRRSRIVVSPYGYGEICYRDFEAVIQGALLLKPDMSHVRTEPDVYHPGETYVPVRWDLADLKEKCLYYARNEAERERITANAREAYRKYFAEQQFVRRVAEILRRAAAAGAEASAERLPHRDRHFAFSGGAGAR